MTKIPLKGVTVATVLPFLSSGSIDWPGYQRLLAYCTAPAGISGVFVNGHAGESAALSDTERASVIRFTRENMRTDQRLIAGLVADTTQQAVAQAKAALNAGADVLTVFPLLPVDGVGCDARDVLAHVQAIGEAADLPLALFQYPIGSGAAYSTPTLVALAALPWVVGIKEGSDTMTLYEDNWRAVKAAAPDVAILPSNFDWFLPQLAVGGDGILSGLASLAPHSLARLWEASERNDLVAMRAVSDSLYPLVRAIYALPRADMYARIKLALQHLGMIDSAHSRSSKTTFGTEATTALASAMTHAGLATGTWA